MVDVAARFPDDILRRWMKMIQEWDARGDIPDDEEWVRRLQQAFASELDGVPLDVETIQHWRTLLRENAPPLETYEEDEVVHAGVRPRRNGLWDVIVLAVAGFFLTMQNLLRGGDDTLVPRWTLYLALALLAGAGFIFWIRRRDVDLTARGEDGTLPLEARVHSGDVPDERADGEMESEPPEEEPLYWKCGECGNVVAEDAKRCGQCGAEL